MDAMIGEYSLRTILLYGGGAVAGIVVLMILKGIFSGPKEGKHVQGVSCHACGWKGQVSRYVGRCPKCNNPLGDRKAGN